MRSDYQTCSTKYNQAHLFKHSTGAQELHNLGKNRMAISVEYFFSNQNQIKPAASKQSHLMRL